MKRIVTLIALLVSIVGFAAAARADEAPAKSPAPDAGFGMCGGISTRCDLLPKGICYMQVGCFNPAFGDRCAGSAKQCTGFSTKNPCMMQRGCTWLKQKPKGGSAPSHPDERM